MVLVQRPRRPRDVNRRSSGCRPGAWELVAPGRRSRFPDPRHGPRACIAPPLLARPRPVILLCGDQDHMATPADKSSLFAPALTRHGTPGWTVREKASQGLRDSSGSAVSASAMQQLRTGSNPTTRTV